MERRINVLLYKGVFGNENLKGPVPTVNQVVGRLKILYKTPQLNPSTHEKEKKEASLLLSFVIYYTYLIASFKVHTSDFTSYCEFNFISKIYDVDYFLPFKFYHSI